MSGRTVGDLIAACAAALGVTRVFGRSLPGLPGIPVADDDLAALLADADGRLNRMGAAYLSDGTLRLSSQPGAEPEPVEVTAAEDLPASMVFTGGQELPGAYAVTVALDLDQPVPDGLQPAGTEVTLERIRLSPDLGTDGIVILAGPGVLREDAADDLVAFARATGWGVVNTFGAKGVLPWDDPHHLGTAGLQARDFELAGLTDALFVVVVGVDTDEVPPGGVGGAQQLTLHPRHLMGAADGWPDPTGEPQRPPLYDRLAEVIQPGYEDNSVPAHPARIARLLAEQLPPDGLVVADPGPAGLWIGRAFPTMVAGSVLVPATPAPGIAAAVALVAGMDLRPALAVTTDPIDEHTESVVELAEALQLGLTVEAWGGDGSVTGDEVVEVRPVPVDFSATDDLIAVAGEVTAWR